MTAQPEVSERLRTDRIASRRGQAVLAATRRLVGRHGIEGATFDLITEEADVGRGTIHWAYGSKERLLLELLNADAAARLDALREAITPVASTAELVEAFAAHVRWYLNEELGVHVLLQELSSLALREPTVRHALASRRREWGRVFTELLETKEAEGVITLAGEPGVVAGVLTALGHGVAMHALLDPDPELEPLMLRAQACAASLVGASEVVTPAIPSALASSPSSR